MVRSSTLHEIDEELSRAGNHLRFRPGVEDAYQRVAASTRNRSIQRYLYTYLCANLLCLPCDYQAGSRAFHLGLIFRVGCLAPLVCAVVLVLKSRFSAAVQSFCAIAPLLFGTTFVALLARLTPQPFTDRYLLGAAVGIMAQTLIAPIPFLFSLTALACSTALLAALGLLPLRGGLFPPVTPDLIFFVAGVGACFLYHRYTLERSIRRDYLLSEANRLHTEQVVKANAHLERLSSIDSLTGVFNRRYLDAALIRLWNLARANERWIAVLMVDIDNFKLVNDTHGHQHGDVCLEHVGQALQKSIRAGVDTVARYGGEEFVALLPDADESVAQEIASRVRQHIQDLGLPAYSECVVTVSVGVAAVKGGQGDLTLPDLIAAADSALYEAKRAGRNQVISGSHMLTEQTAFDLTGV